jgi:ATP synthase protein I
VQPYWKGYGDYGSIGLELVLSVLFGLGVGWWLDSKLGTRWVTWVGLGFGIAAGYRTLYRALKRANREAREAEERDERARKEFHESVDSEHVDERHSEP